ncbi:MAG TPA: hypothetical protein VFC44_12830 [Candidatus Saccharimonadales bacterium]|nr:hypothetical protein [Candidatus Saccharimonadales bacterium]
MRRLIRWAVYLVIIVIALFAAAILLLDRVVKEVMISRIHQGTGMETEIGDVEVGLLSPTITIKNFRLYNTPEFGGSIFLDMPELHLEYDPYRFRARELHLKLVRLNLAELSLIQDKKGRVNLQQLEKKSAVEGGPVRKSSSQKLTFTGIDTLNLSLGKFRMSNLATHHEQEITFGVKNQIFRDVKSEADLTGLSLLMAMKGGALSTGTNSGIDLTALLKSLTH